jgi:hypothetical protein
MIKKGTDYFFEFTHKSVKIACPLCLFGKYSSVLFYLGSGGIAI